MIFPDLKLKRFKSPSFVTTRRGRAYEFRTDDFFAAGSWRIYADFAQELIQMAKRLYIRESFGVELEQTVYALDATIIDLCLSVFPWARFRKRKGAVKLHTLLDLRGSIPSLIVITHGKAHEVNILDDLFFEAGAIYIMDRGYLDFARLYKIQTSLAFFVIRAKSNFRFQRIHSLPVEEKTGVECDQIVALKGFYTKKDFPERLRRIRYFDAATNNPLVFLTNNFQLPVHDFANFEHYAFGEKTYFTSTYLDNTIGGTEDCNQLNLFN